MSEIATPAPDAEPASAPAGPADAGRGDVTATEPTRAQAQLARRVAESRAIVPTFTVRRTIDMVAAVAFREGLAAEQAPPTINDLIIKAAGLALREHPKANGAYRDGHFERYARVNVGFAVATSQLFQVPTIFDADRKPLTQISAEATTLAARVRAREITQPELSGATFAVTNLGMFGVRSFEAIITPPQAAVLSVGALEDRVVARDGAPAIRAQLDVELSCDHRLLYGADAAQLLARIAELLEAPAGTLDHPAGEVR